MTFKHLMLISSAMAGLAAQPVYAQSGDADNNASSNDIIVTARRVEERLQDVPISITAFNQQTLTERNVTSALDLATYTPSLAANPRFGTENTTFSIRGFFQELRTTASVAVYFNDVVAPRGSGSTSGGDGAGPGSFFDLQNVQVLKGPQGTLFGRNTTGGAILLVPNRPTDKFEGYVEGSLGNYDMRRAQAVINAPLAEGIRFRAGVDWQKRDGYQRNISGFGPKDFSNTNYVAARASLVLDLAPDIENYTVASFTRSNTRPSIPKLNACFPAAIPGGSLACNQLAREAGNDVHDIANTQADPVSYLKQWQVINTTKWDVSDALTIKNIASYSKLRTIYRTEAFGTDWIIPATFLGRPTGALAGTRLSFVPILAAPGHDSNDQSSFTEELQVQGRSADGALVWQAGGYYESSKPGSFVGTQNPTLMPCTNIPALQCTDVVGRLLGREGLLGSLSRSLVETKFRNIGVYAQATYALTEQLKVTGGLRYTWDKTDSVAFRQVFRFPAANDARLYCVDPIPGPSGPVGGSFANSIPLSQINTACRSTYSQKSTAPTWTIGLDYKPTDDVMVYGKYSRGYRQGSTNPFSATGFTTFEPEKVDTFEVGAKTSWRGSVPGHFNISGFYNKFSDQQVQVGFRSSTSAISPNVGILNAGKSRIYGIEVSAHVEPIEGLNLGGEYTYLNTKLESLVTPSIPAGSFFDIIIPTSVAGKPLPFSPEHKLSLSATYTLPLSEDVGRVSFGAVYSYTSSAFYSYQSAAGIMPSWNVVNLNLNWESVAGSPLDLALFMTNVTNEKYIMAVNDQASSGFLSSFYGEPRTYGARVRIRFGN